MSQAIFARMERCNAEVANLIRQLLGEAPYSDDCFSESDRQRRVDAMLAIAANPMSDADRHAQWCEQHRQLGWTYGSQMDVQNKVHPNLVPWEELPEVTRLKIKVFTAFAIAAGDLASVIASEETP